MMHPPLDSAQGASSFNQPLSLETSSVTDFTKMFSVRFARSRRSCHITHSVQSGPGSPALSAVCSPARRLHGRRPRGATSGLEVASHRKLPVPFGRAQTPCPTRTSWSSVAHGRATRPSHLLATTRIGHQEAARVRNCPTGQATNCSPVHRFMREWPECGVPGTCQGWFLSSRCSHERRNVLGLSACVCK